MKSINMLLLLIAGLINLNTFAEEISDEKLKIFKESVTEESIGNYTNAIKLIEKLHSKNKNDYLTNLRLGWLNYLDKKYDESIAYYEEAVRLSDKSIESMLGLTYPYSAKQEWGKVEDIYKDILDVDNQNYTANMNLGKLFFNNASYINAKNYFENIFDNYPSDTDANLYLGWIYYYLGNKSLAKKHFTNTLILDSDNTSAIEGLNLTR
jgi:tetratricopeptide (TPR) repeat protein